MKRTTVCLIVLALLALAAPLCAAGPAPGVIGPSADAQARFVAVHPGAAFTFGRHGVPSLIRGFSAPLDGADRAAGAQRFVKEWAELLGFNAADGDLARGAAVDVTGGTAYRFRQMHRGLPVVGADVVVLVDTGSRAVMVSSGLAPLDDLPAAFTVPRAAAVKAALDALGSAAASGRVARAERVIAGVAGAHRAVWLIDVITGRPAGSWRVFVAPDEPRAVGVQNRMLTAKGNAFPICPEVGAYQEVTLDNLTSATSLSGTYVDVYSNCLPGPYAACSDADRQAAADGNGDFLYKPAEPAAKDPFAEVNAYYQLSQMHDYFVQQGFTQMDLPLSIAVSYTDAQQGMNCNGGYMGYEAIVLGLCTQSSPAVNFAYDAPVIRHEYTHGMVDQTAQLVMYEIDDYGLVGMPGGLNEGYADTMAAISVNDSRIGRHVAKAFQQGSALRDLSQFNACPDDLKGETHEDGKVWGSANWAAYKNTRDDPVAGKVILEGLATLSGQATIQEAGQATMQAATAHGQPVQDAFQKAYQTHGILTCAREIEVVNGKSLIGWLLNPQMLYLQSSQTPFLVQFKVNVPAGATRLEVETSATDLLTGSDMTSRVSVYVNKDSHVSYGPPLTAGWNTGGRSVFTIDSPEAGWYYFLPVGSRYGGQTEGYQFTFTPRYVLPPGADAGVDAGPADAAEDAGSDSGDTATSDDTGAPKADAGQPTADTGPSGDAADTPSDSSDEASAKSEAAEGSGGGCGCTTMTM